MKRSTLGWIMLAGGLVVPGSAVYLGGKWPFVGIGLGAALIAMGIFTLTSRPKKKP